MLNQVNSTSTIRWHNVYPMLIITIQLFQLNQKNLAGAEREHITNIIKKIKYAHHILIDIPHEWIIYDNFNS